MKWISRRSNEIHFSLKATSRRLCEKSGWVLKLEKNNSVHPTLHLNDPISAMYLTARSRETDPHLRFHSAMRHAPLQTNECATSTRDSTDFPQRQSRWLFFPRFLIVNQPCERVRLSSQCNYAGCLVVRDSGKILRRETRPIGSHVNEPFTSSSFQRSTFWSTISSPSTFHAAGTPNYYDTFW